jgi:catechol 2,3-dioxygenase-like lactoylglutathione lyase family enzyme
VSSVELARIAYGVSDPVRSAKWYRSAGFDAATIEQLDPRAAPAQEHRVEHVGAVHICLRTADIAGAHARLLECGARFAAPPARHPAGPSLAYFHDPQGTLFQLLEIDEGPLARGRPPALAEATGTLHHVGLTVAELDASVAWFERELGAPVVVRAHASGPPAGAALGLPETDYRAVSVGLGEHSIELLEFAVGQGTGDCDACLTLNTANPSAAGLNGPQGLRLRLLASPAGA